MDTLHLLQLVISTLVVTLNVKHATGNCEDLGGVQIGRQCLAFHVHKVNWGRAKEECESRGARLASLADPLAVMDYRDKIYGNRGFWEQNFWVGGSDASNEGRWMWLNGKPLDHSFPWSSGEPNGGVGENCLMTFNNTGYNDWTCDGEKIGFICELVTCDAPGAQIVGGQCLYFSTDTDGGQAWNEAIAFCKKKGGELASLLHPQALKDYLAANNGPGGLVGGTDAAREGVWVWLNGQNVDRDLPWSAAYGGQPEGGSSQNCLFVHGDGYHDGPCSGAGPFICDVGVFK